ncbi:MAG: DUF4190 domain-containing protein [Christensenellaceae bacterium]|jgi:ABC-type antimicrobial peptide transport system permease subunit
MNAGAAPTQALEEKSKGMGIAAMVLGIVSLVMCWIPFFNLLASIVGLVLGIIAAVQDKKNAFAIVGIVLSSIGFLLAVLYLLGLFFLIGVGIHQLDFWHY